MCVKHGDGYPWARLHAGLGKVMVPVSLLSQCLDLQWAYLADIDALIITRREPALEGRCIMLDAGHGR